MGHDETTAVLELEEHEDSDEGHKTEEDVAETASKVDAKGVVKVTAQGNGADKESQSCRGERQTGDFTRDSHQPETRFQGLRPEHLRIQEATNKI